MVRAELPDDTARWNSEVTLAYAGQATTTTNALGQVRTETRNALGEVISTADPAGTTVSHEYDAWGQVVRTTTSGAGASPVVVETDYDERGRRKARRDPDRGAWTYEYNGFDELLKQTDAAGNVQVMTYDGLGRLHMRRDYAAGGALTAAFAFMLSSAVNRVLGSAMVSAGPGDGMVAPDRDALQAELDELVKRGILSGERTFANADDAALEVLNATAPLSQKYGLEVAGSIYSGPDGGFRYTLPVIGGAGTASLDTGYVGYHTHPSDEFKFSNQFWNYSGNPSLSDMAWMASSGRSLYLGVQVDNAVRIGVCSPGACYDTGIEGTDPGRVLQ